MTALPHPATNAHKEDAVSIQEVMGAASRLLAATEALAAIGARAAVTDPDGMPSEVVAVGRPARAGLSGDAGRDFSRPKKRRAHRADPHGIFELLAAKKLGPLRRAAAVRKAACDFRRAVPCRTAGWRGRV